MSYFRKTPKLAASLDLVTRDTQWLVVINADPDAMASAMALKRIMSRRTPVVDIAKINEISRPDNLAMIRYTHLHMLHYSPDLLQKYTHFALVDSQPSHNPQFQEIPFSIIIDHHPLATPHSPRVYLEILPEYGATSTIFTEYLYNLNIRPGQLLATALQFGIRTDTMSFQRNVGEVDLRAYQYLSKFAGQTLLNRIIRSEFHADWLPYFAKAITRMQRVGNGNFVYVGEVENPDILVLIADFFTRVYEIRWVAVAGYCGAGAVVIFRSDGFSQDVGRLAHLKFNALGSAGGHKTMARAEFPVSAAEGQDLAFFLYKKLLAPMPKEQHAVPAPENNAPGKEPEAAGSTAQDAFKKPT